MYCNLCFIILVPKISQIEIIFQFIHVNLKIDKNSKTRSLQNYWRASKMLNDITLYLSTNHHHAQFPVQIFYLFILCKFSSIVNVILISISSIIAWFFSKLGSSVSLGSEVFTTCTRNWHFSCICLILLSWSWTFSIRSFTIFLYCAFYW